jgi:hypothetical protein
MIIEGWIHRLNEQGLPPPGVIPSFCLEDIP